MKNENPKITIYSDSEFMGNMIKYEGKLIEFGTRKYAQYDRAPFVTFIPAGKRKAVMIQKTYRPMLLILAGTGHPNPPSMFTKNISDSMMQSTYSSFDERWDTDFNAMINKYIADSGATVIADYRHTSGVAPVAEKRETFDDYVQGLRNMGLTEKQVQEAVKASSV